jgi:hypothetical protein
VKEPLEEIIEEGIRVALFEAGVWCQKHRVDPCHLCMAKPRRGQGLGHGCPDLICVVPPFGRFLAIEVKRKKTRNAKRDAHQRLWMGAIRRFGGIAGVATNVAEALALLELARCGT